MQLKNAISLVFFGQINPYKGVLLILEAVEYLVKHQCHDFHIHLFGNIASGFPQFKVELLEFLNRHQDLVTHHGKYQQTDIPDLIQLVDWVIVPSIWWENSPLVIQEVFMHQRPIICSDIGGMAEKVADKVTGMHFQVRNAASLAKTMKLAIDDEKLWSNLVNNIQPRLSIKQSAIEHITVYEI